MMTHSKSSLNTQTRNAIAATVLFVFLFASLGMTLTTAATPTPRTKVTFTGLPIVQADGIPVVAGHKWKMTSNSNQILLRCLSSHDIVGGFHVRTQQYANDLAKSYAFISYVAGMTAKPIDIANDLQICLNAVKSSHQVGGMGPEGYANVGFNNGVRSYAFATLYQDLMFVTYWAQPGVPEQDQSPAVVLMARALVMNELAAKGITNPYAVKCAIPRSGKTTPLPTEVRAMILKSFAKLAPISISKKQIWPVNVREQSSTPHICLWPWGFPEAWSGPVPPSATRALEVAVKHAPDPVSAHTYNYLTFALMPGGGWMQVSSSSLP